MERRGLNIRKGFLKFWLPMIRALPLPVASRFVSGIGRLEYRVSHRLRQAFQQAVEHGREVLACQWDVPAVSRELAGNHILWRTRDLLLDGVADHRVREMFVVSGRHHLDAALSRGRGCLVLASHFGAHLLPAHWLFREQYPVRFYMERPRHISRFLARHFDTDGPLGQEKLFISRQGVPADSASSILRAARTLKAGLLLYLAGDVRWTGQLTESARFLGRTMRFSTTWVVLAAMTEAPVVMVFCRMEPDGRYHIEFLPPFQVPKDAPEKGETGRWVRNFLAILEDQVRRYPTNSNDYFFWGESEDLVA
ncbi:MAG TPA: lysophospholipid acyltransferase family protein [Isosphaeraceae bacterium]|nr:lysophospholipid acyltransferase family protein [Isosphaeraceae bacterium]